MPNPHSLSGREMSADTRAFSGFNKVGSIKKLDIWICELNATVMSRDAARAPWSSCLTSVFGGVCASSVQKQCVSFKGVVISFCVLASFESVLGSLLGPTSSG